METVMFLRRLYRETQPDLVLAYTVKPVIWSGIALRGLRRTRFVALITGLGYTFHGEGVVRWGLRRLVSWLYRVALRRAERVVFQNADDQAVFISAGLTDRWRCALVAGSGVDLERFSFSELPAGPARFVMLARLLWAKGVREYVEAAALVRQHAPEVTFDLIGPLDESPDAIPLSQVRAWEATGAVVYRGALSDVRAALAAAHVVVLPSYHEGLPRSLTEGMAMGRVVLATDVPGCRETVIKGENGILVKVGSVKALADGMRWLLAHRAHWPFFGRRSRDLAAERFEAGKISGDMIRLLALPEGENATETRS
jgi:glycosyltransferase involved in cell wall biosynthesis